MQKAFTTVLLLAGVCLFARPCFSGVTLMPEKPAAIEYDPKTGFPDHNGDFSAMVIVIPQQQLAEFDKADGGARQISRVNRAEPGAQLAIKLVFTGLAIDSNGNGEVTYDLKVLTPDGQIYAASDYRHLAAVRGPVSDGRRVFDNRTKVVLMSFDPQDKPGVYTIKAVARDEVSEREVPLVTTIELLPAAPAKAETPPVVEAPVPAPVKAKKTHRKKRARR
jgi:hypothetical protein